MRKTRPWGITSKGGKRVCSARWISYILNRESVQELLLNLPRMAGLNGTTINGSHWIECPAGQSDEVENMVWLSIWKMV